MSDALNASLVAALLLAALVRATRPGGLLAFLAIPWQWWAIHKPMWLPDKPTGACAMCTAFWFIGVPVAVAVALCTPAGWWAITVPPMVAVLAETLLIRR